MRVSVAAESVKERPVKCRWSEGKALFTDSEAAAQTVGKPVVHLESVFSPVGDREGLPVWGRIGKRVDQVSESNNVSSQNLKTFH